MTFPYKHGSDYPDSILALVFIPIIWVLIVLRFIVRYAYTRNNLGLDDLCCFLAGCMFTLQASCSFVENKLSVEIPLAPNIIVPKIITWALIIGAVSYGGACLFIKLSLGLSYLRVLTNSKARYLCYATMIFSTAVNLDVVFFCLFRCGGNPTKLAQKTFEGKCHLGDFTSRFQVYFQSASNLLCDFSLTLLPLIAVFQTSFDWRSKASVAFILSLAGGGTVCSMVRVAFLHRFLSPSYNNVVPAIIVSDLDSALFLTFGCLATLRPLLIKAFPILKTEAGRGTRQYELKDFSQDNTAVCKTDGDQEKNPSVATTV